MEILKNSMFTKYRIYIIMAIGIVCLAAIIIAYGEYRRNGLEKQIILQAEITASTSLAFEGKIKGLEDKITSIVTQNNLLNEVVQTEITKNDVLADQVEQVSDTAVALDKLSKVDPQLLQKYSKVYFLNEHYIPDELNTIPVKYGYDSNTRYQILDKISPYLEEMLKAAMTDEVDIKVVSAYRSFDTQGILKSSYQVTYGVGTANQFSADQGYSEHQLGTTVDFTTSDIKEDSSLFDKTPTYTWLKNNAYKYGFILSYPENNAYYIYEPWHWRFVGVDLANKLHRENKYFYDLDQRIINNYLGVFFD